MSSFNSWLNKFNNVGQKNEKVLIVIIRLGQVGEHLLTVAVSEPRSVTLGFLPVKRFIETVAL